MGQTDFQRLFVIRAISTGQLSCHLWHPMTECSQRYVHQKETGIWTVAPRKSASNLSFCHAMRNGSLLRVGCEIVKSQMSEVLPRIPTESQLRPPWEMCHHCLNRKPTSTPLRNVSPLHQHVCGHFQYLLAQLKLYSYLEQLQQWVIYFDTD